MTLTEVVQLIGDVLTAIDVLLRGPDLSVSSPEWQQLWALRKHLDDQQRELVAAEIDVNTTDYAAITSRLAATNQELDSTLDDIKKIATTIQTVSTIASILDGLLKLA